MVFRAPPNCQHLDNWRGCKHPAHQAWLHRLLDVRPHCVLDRLDEPRDGIWTCDEQEPYARPRPPITGSGVLRVK